VTEHFGRSADRAAARESWFLAAIALDDLLPGDAPSAGDVQVSASPRRYSPEPGLRVGALVSTADAALLITRTVADA
jgi:hypothetical protein